MVQTALEIIAGLPYSRRIRVVKGATIWPTVDDFEIRSQIRVSETSSSRLKAILTPYFTASVSGEDLLLDLVMTGSQTRSLNSGYYDIIVSDKNSTDARAIRVLGGPIQITRLVTGE